MNITTIQPRVVEILLTAPVFKTHVDCRGQVGRRHLLGTAINIQIYSFADHLTFVCGWGIYHFRPTNRSTEPCYYHCYKCLL